MLLSMASVLVVRSAGSGEVLAELDGNDFHRMVETHGNTAKALKLELKDQGFGCRFLQRLLNDSGEIPDDEILVPPVDLKLVRLSLCPFDRADAEALAEASKEGRLEEVETRLKKPQDPNAVNKEGRGALYCASENGHTEVVRLLVDAGADCDQAHRCHAPLHIAAWQGHVEVVRLLLAAGASCDLALAGNRTALLLAARQGHVEVVRLLLEAGSSLKQDRGGFTPLHFAAMKGHTQVVRLLLEGRADCDRADGQQGISPLHFAAMNGHVEVAHLLLEAGASCELAGNGGLIALHHAAAHGHMEVVRLLLEAGAPCDDDTRYVLLRLAADKGHAEICHLLERGAPSKKRRKCGER